MRAFWSVKDAGHSGFEGTDSLRKKSTQKVATL